jgi:hypothetical protein
MWFFFGFITLGVACISSLFYRLSVSWHGSAETEQGIDFEYAASIVKRRVRLIRVGVTCAKASSFTLKPEGSFDRLSKAVGLTKECQTGDSAFDAAIYVLSDDLALHRMLQLDSKLRANIRRLEAACNAEGQLKSIQAHDGRLWVIVDPETKDEDEAEHVARRIVPALNHLADDFATGSPAARAGRDPFPFRAACMLALSTGLAINGGFALVRMMPGDFPFLVNTVLPLPGALLIGAVAVVALIALTLWFVGRSARAHLVLIELLMVGSFGAVTTAYAELRDYNMDFDQQVAAQYAAVTGTYDTYTTHKGHKTRHCHVQMIGWPFPEHEVEREMSCDFADRLQRGTRLEIQSHPGALGWAWVSDFVIR